MINHKCLICEKWFTCCEDMTCNHKPQCSPKHIVVYLLKQANSAINQIPQKIPLRFTLIHLKKLPRSSGSFCLCYVIISS